MTPEQTIEMAKQAGFGISKYTHMTFDCVHVDELQAFTQLVRNETIEWVATLCDDCCKEQIESLKS